MGHQIHQHSFNKGEIMSDKRKEIWTSVFFIGLSIVYFCGTFSIRDYNAFGVTVLSSASVPRALAIILLILSLLHIAQVMLDSKSQKNDCTNDRITTNDKEIQGVDIQKELAEAEKMENAGKVCNQDVVLTVVFLILYVICLVYLGFIISTLIYIVIQSELMTQKDKRKKGFIKSAILAGIATVTIYFLFNNMLSLLLPVGIFGF